MSDLMNKVKTINSAVRTVLALGLVGGLGFFGWFGYTNYIKPGAMAKQAIADLEEMKLEFERQEEALQVSEKALLATRKINERLETSMKLLKVDRRIANVTVIEKSKDDEGPFMEVQFTEVDKDDRPIGISRNFTIRGEKLYVDGWIVSFDDKYVEDADELRAASLYVFKSIYGDQEKPVDGQKLDVASQDSPAPGIYNDNTKRDFEQKIWGDFWKVSNDSYLQQELGIRASHGLAGYVKPIEGKTYQVSIRASGGMTLTPIEEP
jgi:hypothetical protein